MKPTVSVLHTVRHPYPIWFVRHGETDWNAEGRLQGQRDIPLNDLGRVQAQDAARTLATLVARPDDLVWVASPLSRTRETATIMRETLELPAGGVRLDDRLKEITFGRWEGLTWPDVKRTDPGGALARERDKWGSVPPDGESYSMLVERIMPAIQDFDRASVIVSHGGVARGLMHALCGHAPERAPLENIWQGRVLLIADGAFRWI